MTTMQTVREPGLRGFVLDKLGRRSIPIATKLTLSFLLVIIMTSAIFTFTSIWLIQNRIVAEAQETVKRDLNSARELFTGQLQHINDVVRLTADRYIIITAMKSGNSGDAAVELLRIKKQEDLDLLTITDAAGTVLVRANNWEPAGGDQSKDELVAAVCATRFQSPPHRLSLKKSCSESLLCYPSRHFSNS